MISTSVAEDGSVSTTEEIGGGRRWCPADSADMFKDRINETNDLVCPGEVAMNGEGGNR